MNMKTTITAFALLGASIALSACNDAFVAGMASGLANRPAPTYSSTPASTNNSNALIEKMKRDREAKRIERNMKDMCENGGGRWRVGRCKY